MPLTPGTRLGPYAITAQIGVGGMGEVYQATDTNLKRQVAIKVLPESLAGDTERLARFQREAVVLASLNHPNIAQIHGLEKSDGTTALVMELVEGPTLADRIAQGAIPIDEALPIAKQIAEALEAAHEQGIIHRDLKPANVKVRPDGTVKVLDFGLAKAMEPTGAMSRSVSQLPTITTPAMTQAGMILGTAAYMSPEQARGRATDKRSDIWAFGVVLYEMLTGRRAFPGDDVTDTIAGVVKLEPNWGALGGDVPARVARTLRVCLAKDPQQRGGDIAAIRLALEGAFETEATVEAVDGALTAPAWWSHPRWIASGLVLGLLVGLGTGWAVWLAGRVDADAPLRRFQLAVPASVNFPPRAGTMVGLSPDGQTAVYRGLESGSVHFYQQRLDQLRATVIPGTEGAAQGVFFSPDSQWMAFFLDDTLMRVALAGGSPTRIADLPRAFRGGSWGADDTIVIGLFQGLARLSAEGGEVESLTTPDEGRNHWYPQILPGGRAVLYTDSEARPDSGDVMLLDLDTGEARTVVRGGVAGHYTPTGHLVFLRGGDLWAVRFALDTQTVEGQPALVEEGIRVEGGGAVQFAVAEDGGLVYLTGGTDSLERRTLVWVDREGQEEEVVAAVPADYQEFGISPDGTRIAARVGNSVGDEAVWVYDLTRGTSTRLTFESDNVRGFFPTWTPDGTRVAFGGPLSWKRADGVGAVERLGESPQWGPHAFTPDGTALVFADYEAVGGGGLGVLSLEGDRASTVLLDEEFSERNPALSPDGRWLAYDSNQSGGRQVYVRPFPDVDGGRWQISTDVGQWPVWNPVGNELFYRGLTGVMVQAFETEPTFTPGALTELFERSLLGVTANRRMAVSPDGQRLLLRNEPAGAADTEGDRSEIVVVQNFFTELERLLPTD